MKKYEVGMIIQTSLDQEQTDATIAKMKAIYTDAGCKIVDEANVGIRELAYTIKNKHTNGYYFYMVVEANHEANQEFERIARINSEDIIRFMVIDVDGVAGSTLDSIK